MSLESTITNLIDDMADFVYDESERQLKDLTDEIWDVYSNNPNHILTMINLAEMWCRHAELVCISNTADLETLLYIVHNVRGFIIHSYNQLINIENDNPNMTIKRENWSRFQMLFIDLLLDIECEYIHNPNSLLFTNEYERSNLSKQELEHYKNNLNLEKYPSEHICKCDERCEDDAPL